MMVATVDGDDSAVAGLVKSIVGNLRRFGHGVTLGAEKSGTCTVLLDSFCHTAQDGQVRPKRAFS